ncbi:MAG: gliding motility-associated-like protein [Crocinitomix sp.]
MKKNIFSYCLLLPLIFFGSKSYAQIFNWSDDGFMSNVTHYPNIDSSGIDLDIYNMQTGSPSGGEYYKNWIIVGINNGADEDIQHKYILKFSETVDVEFQIKNINRDTASGFLYNDQLILHNDPIIVDSSYVKIVGDTVFGLWGSDPNIAGFLHLRYENVDSIVIYHGTGEMYNPGYIKFSPLVINNNIWNISKKNEGLPFIVPNVFTPGTDNINDAFTFELIPTGAVKTFNCIIYNRWGALVSELAEITDGWDGTDQGGNLCTDGTYFYSYNTVTSNNNVFSGQGTVQLVRGQ